MYGPRALISMAAVLFVFAGVTYLRTASAWTTFWQALLCALILQIGYFICLLVLVRLERARMRRETSDSPSATRTSESVRGDDLHSAPVSKLKIGDR